VGIHEEGFNRYLPVSASLMQVFRRKVMAQRFWPQMSEERMLVGIGEPAYGSKTARVVEAQAQVAGKKQIDMIMLLHRGALREDTQVPAHPQMDQDRALFQVKQKVFAPSPQVQQTLPGHPPGKIGVHRQTQATIPYHGPLQALSQQMRGDTQSGDFDFGQLGHG
jgi:hypothetical protein